MSKENKKLSQEEIWDKIADPWKKHRKDSPEEVVNFLKNKRGKVLDLSCGSGRNFIKKEDLEIYGVDFSQEMLNYAKKHSEEKEIKVKLIKSQAYKLDFENNFFDSAIFIAALHCIETKGQREDSLKELFRVLKPGSESMITVWDKNQAKLKDKPKEEKLLWKHEGKRYMRYYYFYEKEELKNLLEKTGFKILRISDKENPLGFYSNKNILVIVKKPTSS